jgi:hypothetical protein
MAGGEEATMPTQSAEYPFIPSPDAAAGDDLAAASGGASNLVPVMIHGGASDAGAPAADIAADVASP